MNKKKQPPFGAAVFLPRRADEYLPRARPRELSLLILRVDVPGGTARCRGQSWRDLSQPSPPSSFTPPRLKVFSLVSEPDKTARVAMLRRNEAQETVLNHNIEIS